MGLEVIELSGAKRLLKDALLRGHVVGLLGDRDITGGGIETEFFGAPSPLAVGPALRPWIPGVTPYVFGVWRDQRGVFHVRAEPVPFPTGGDAPRACHRVPGRRGARLRGRISPRRRSNGWQCSTRCGRTWNRRGHGARRAGPRCRPQSQPAIRSRRRHDDRPARAGGPAHPHPRLRRHGRRRRDPGPRRAQHGAGRDRDHRPRAIDAALPAAAMALDAASFEVVVGEEVTTPAATCWRCSSSADSRGRCARRSRDPRPGRPGHPGTPPRALPAVRPGISLRRLLADRPSLPPGRDRGVQPDDARPAGTARARFAEETGWRASATRTPTRRRHRPGYDLPGSDAAGAAGRHRRGDDATRDLPRGRRAARDVRRAAGEERPRRPREPGGPLRGTARARPRLPA